ncbi:MAG: UvrD-helicase domain-containing protein [Bacteroidales bacterium]|nr:UvrD-helicase domain-containing protein [Bacteroidales bacterium]
MSTLNSAPYFYVYKAAAGSGKTYTLVKQYLLMAFDVPNASSQTTIDHALEYAFSRILAITFTNKAAGEMKQRILHYLDCIEQQGEGFALGRELCHELDLSMEQLQHRARVVRSAILHHYSDFAVCTIDSFVHRVVRTFAHDLHLSSGFDLQLDTDDIVQHAVSELMAEVGAVGNADLTEAVCRFAEKLMEDGRSFDVEQRLVEMAARIFDEDSPIYLDSLREIPISRFIEEARRMVEANKQLEQEVQRRGETMLKLFAEQGFVADDFAGKSRGIVPFFKAVAEGNVDKASSPSDTMRGYFQSGNIANKQASPDRRAAIEALSPTICQAFEELMALDYRSYVSRKLMLDQHFTLALLNKLNQLATDYSRDNEVLHISETNKRIAEVVQREPMPFIYERLGSRYTHYMIDEFQDTSRMQWQNLIPLLENGVDQFHRSLVVGDAKQAIYRFRQGNVEQFVQLPHVDSELHADAFSAAGKSSVEILRNNYRSLGRIVDFNNTFFQWVAEGPCVANQLIHDVYIGTPTADYPHPDLWQQCGREGGYVEVQFVAKDENYGHIYETIRQLVEEQGWCFGDILVLAETNQQLAAIAGELGSRRVAGKAIPIVSSESFLLQGSVVVLLLRTLMLLVVRPNDRTLSAQAVECLHLLHRIRTPLSEACLSRRSVWEVLEAEGYEVRPALLRGMSLYDMCEYLLSALSLQGVETAYVAKLLGTVASFSRLHPQDPLLFVEYLDVKLGKLSASAEGEHDAVRLLTVHKAKGLESPVVIMPVHAARGHGSAMWIDRKRPVMPFEVSYVSLPSETKARPSWFDEEFADERAHQELDMMNKFYVAFTRPREQLYLFCDCVENGFAGYLYDFVAQGAQSGRWQKRSEPSAEQEGVQVATKSRGSKKAADRCGQVFTFGRQESRQGREERVDAQRIELLTDLVYPAWQPRIAVATGERRQQSSRDRGNRLHAMLEQVRTVEDVEAAVAAYFHQYECAEAQEDYVGMLTAMLSQPEVAPFFAHDAKVLAEQSLIYHGETLRPDRIVISGGDVSVVDFKTGAPSAAHQRQVETYVSALREAGYDRVRGFLLYVGSPARVVPVEM